MSRKKIVGIMHSSWKFFKNIKSGFNLPKPLSNKRRSRVINFWIYRTFYNTKKRHTSD